MAVFEQTLKTDSFLLRIKARVFEDDLRHPVNAVLTLSVDSNGFAAESSLDIDIKELASFSERLAAVYDTLSGDAVIKEPYGYERFVSFAVGKNGYISVKGFLCDDTRSNELHFENRFDQTYLKDFSSGLCSMCLPYGKSA